MELSSTYFAPTSSCVFDVNDSVALAPEIPEMLIDIELQTTNGYPVAVVKTGDGALAFERASSLFYGSAAVSNGVLLLNGYAAACGPFGVADVTVSGAGTLGGIGGVGGSVFIENGGTLDPGALDNSIGNFTIGTNLIFSAGGNLKIDIASEDVCDTFHVAGDIALDGGALCPTLLPGTEYIYSEWVIATYEGTASGSMSAPEGFRVFIDAANKQVRMVKRPFATLLLVR